MQSLISSQDAAKLLGIAEQSLRHDRVSGRLGIPYYRVGARIAYSTDDLTAWLSARREVPSPTTKPERRPRGRATKREQLEASRRGITVSELRTRNLGVLR